MKQHLQSVFNTRQHMVSENFELYYYNDLNLSPVPAHKHNFYEFFFFLDGNIEFLIEDNSYPVKYGDFLLIPPGIRHNHSFIDKEKSYRRFVLWVSKEYYDNLTEGSKSYCYLPDLVTNNKRHLFHNDNITFNAIQSMLFRLIEESKNSRFGKETELILQLNSLLLHLNRLVYEVNHNQTLHTGQELYIRLCNYISDNLEGDLSLDRLEKDFFVSKFYISHHFKENMGLSLHQYIIKKRLNACKDAILGNTPITKLYSLYGFSDYSSFFRSFKREYGISPNDYKALHRLPDMKQ